MEKVQLRIFFPKLRKIKAVPFKGTGKHKYSFQRVEVPPLPVHFCDCEEHFCPAETVKEKASNHESENFGVNEEELNIMKSVMNKILERENCSNATRNKAGFTMEVNDSATLLNNVQVDDNGDDQGTDEDSLIINMVAGPNDRSAFFKDQRQEAAAADWDSTLTELKTSNDRHPREVHRSQKRETVASKKRRKTSFDEDDRNDVSGRKRMKGSPPIVINKLSTDVNTQPEETESGSAQLNHDASPSQKSEYLVSQKDSTEHMENSTSHGPEVKEQQSLIDPGFTDKENQSSQVKELEKITDVISDIPRATVDKSARGASWLQKSSWTQLVGDTHNSSFSISQVLPGATFEKQELPQFNHFVFSRTNKPHKSFEKETSNSVEGVSKPKGGANKNLATADHKFDVDALTRKEQNGDLNCEKSSPEMKMQIIKDNEVSTSTLGQNVPSALNRPSLGDIVTSEACPFMRSAASMKEWTKTKAALSGSFKKKR
ncbi:Hypothetical predicted protein [Olea europaea subsp. europaea]|nr:Hypothetical predicted protein [Olea europaea subsp. europaea]